MKKILIPVGVLIVCVLGMFVYLFRIIFLGIFLCLWHFKLPKKYFFMPYKSLHTNAGHTWYNYEIASSLKDAFVIFFENAIGDENPKVYRKKYISPNLMFIYKEHK